MFVPVLRHQMFNSFICLYLSWDGYDGGMRQLWLLLLTTTEQNNDIISVTFFYLFIDINILLKSSMPLVYRWWNMVLANRWLRVEHCCTVMSYDALGHFLIFIWLLGPLAFFKRTNIIQMIFFYVMRIIYIMYNTQDYSFL